MRHSGDRHGRCAVRHAASPSPVDRAGPYGSRLRCRPVRVSPVPTWRWRRDDDRRYVVRASVTPQRLLAPGISVPAMTDQRGQHREDDRRHRATPSPSPGRTQARATLQQPTTAIRRQPPRRGEPSTSPNRARRASHTSVKERVRTEMSSSTPPPRTRSLGVCSLILTPATGAWMPIVVTLRSSHYERTVMPLLLPAARVAVAWPSHRGGPVCHRCLDDGVREILERLVGLGWRAPRCAAGCGRVVLDRRKRGQGALVCSPRCRRTVRNDDRRMERRSQRQLPPLQCVECGETLVIKRSDLRYCSRRCRVRSHRKRRRMPVTP